MEGSVLSFLKAEQKVSDTGSAHSENICFKMSFYEFSKLEALSELSLCRSPFVLL
jgi:hypothetical protein